ncbi:MAG: M24 family metallopeptidase [Rhodospirillaceae bacterium]
MGAALPIDALLPPPKVDLEALRSGRLARLKAQIRAAGVDLLILTNPISLRYAIDFRTYALFNAHIPTSYLFVSADGPTILFGAYGPPPLVDEARIGRPISFFDGGDALATVAADFAGDVEDYLVEAGATGHRVAVEYVNPSITQALERRGIGVQDGVCIAERARLIKLPEELVCMRHAVAVAELGLQVVRDSIAPGVTETALLAVFNAINIAHDGDWQDGRMLASGPRMNPWCQEASPRPIQAGELVGLDTDMIGPFGYFADISRTFFCGPGRPSARQKQLYRIAVDEIEHNRTLIKPGLGFSDFAQAAYRVDPDFHANAYTCISHGAGMCDEYPRVNHPFREPAPYDGAYQAGMVITLESYVGAVGEPDGVKLEQQILITEDGSEPLSTFPYEDVLLE